MPVGKNWGNEEPESWGTLVYTENEEYIEELVETIPGDYRIFYDNLFEVIRNKKQLLVKPEEALAVLEILEACLLSDKEKRTIVI